MKLYRPAGVLLLFFSIILVHDVSAQRKSKGYLKRKNRKIGNYKGGSIHFDKNKRYLSLGASLDAVNYFGDLAPKSQIASTNISFTRPAFTIFGSFRYTPNLTLRGSLSWGRIVGDDFKSADPQGADSKFRYIRNMSFRNDIKELAFTAVWDIYGNHGTFLNRVSFTPYAFAGLAVFHHNPKARAPELDKFGQPLEEAGEWVALRDLGTEGQLSEHYNVKQYSVIQPSIPFGIGLRAKLQKRLDFEFEVGYRFLFTDYLDDVSGNYVDLGALDSELARAMSDRSREPTGVVSGDPRDFEVIEANTNLYTYTSQFDGREYTVYAGYGQDHPSANRGFSNDKDIYIVTSFKISYIISGSFRRAKFR
ncbi:MAG: DUF6089 family protein [Cytophagales bacterium]|nr:DUF6089 family protein [Cytophagales bacterium]